MCQFEEFPNYILMSILSLLKPSKANTLPPWIFWAFILIFCRCGISKSPWMAWSRQFFKFEIDSMIMWSCDWLRPLKDRLHVTWSGFSLAWLRQGLVIPDLSEVPGSQHHINFENIQDISKLGFKIQNGYDVYGHRSDTNLSVVAGNLLALFGLAIVFFSNWFTNSSAGKQTRNFSAFSINMDIKFCSCASFGST